MSNSGPVFFMVAAFAFVVFMLFLMPRLDRQRITEQVESHGGKVVDTLSDWFSWGSRSARTYDVTYVTPQHERITAKCATSMFRGVQWLSDTPPGRGMQPGEALEEIEPRKETEPIDCIQCGGKIPPGKASCALCGWSYKAT